VNPLNVLHQVPSEKGGDVHEAGRYPPWRAGSFCKRVEVDVVDDSANLILQ